MIMPNTDFLELLKANLPKVEVGRLTKIVQFRELILQENKVQNLTRLTTPEDFFYGHTVDAIELIKAGLIDYPAIDMGSGAGVPGILCAILEPQSWILCESEKKKAQFLIHCLAELKLENVHVVADRTENWLKDNEAQSIVARAVGPIDRIYGWLSKCSTWNNLVLLKGPSWDEEWAQFSSKTIGKKLQIVKKIDYEIGTVEKRSRCLVKIKRL